MTDNPLTQMRKALEEILNSLPEDDGWWCPYCGETDCTFDGRCDKCGTPLEDYQLDVTRIDAIKKALQSSTGWTCVREDRLNKILSLFDLETEKEVCEMCPACLTIHEDCSTDMKAYLTKADN